MATAPSPNDLTRQQLDELDALLQKMLTVPLSAETPPPVASLNAMPQAPLPPSWRVDSPAPSVTQSMPHISLDEESAPMSLKFETPASRVTPAPQPAPAPKPQATQSPPPKTPAPVAATPAPAVAAPPAPKSSQTVAPVPIPQPKPLSMPVAKSPLSAPVPAIVPAPASASAIPAPNAVTPIPSTPPVALPLLPLVAFNSLFNGVCGILGPVGKLLRSGFFKQIYGLAGLGLLAYTAAHVAQVQGWITLPVQLPWPK